MHHSLKSTSNVAASAVNLVAHPKAWLAALILIAGVSFTSHARAAVGLCNSGTDCSPSRIDSNATPETQLLEFAAALQASVNGRASVRRHELSSQEYHSFSGVGAIVCSINGRQRMSTAFLVGAFDIAVTVAHTFDDNGVPVSADNCIYTSTDSLGQIRERIEVSYIKSQWDAEAGAAGHTSMDFAVVRLREPSHYAQRTMPLGKFSGAAVPVLMIGFRDDLESDPLKSKGHGTVYARTDDGISLAALEGFTHDIDARGIAAGAPVIDERTGVIIGIHTLRTQPGIVSAKVSRRNAMITMNEWLEQTLRVEMQIEEEKGANAKP